MAILIAILASCTGMSLLTGLHRYHVVLRMMQRGDTAARAAMIASLRSADVLTQWAVAAWVRRVDKGETERIMNYQNDRQQRNQDALKLLSELDRCEHGRHEGDSCFDCPDRYSTGNPRLPAGARIGTAHGGDPIYMPKRGVRHLPDRWRVDPATPDADR